jgi:hypothetical protein
MASRLPLQICIVLLTTGFVLTAEWHSDSHTRGLHTLHMDAEVKLHMP